MLTRRLALATLTSLLIVPGLPALAAAPERPARDVLSQTYATFRQQAVRHVAYDLRFRFDADKDTYTGEATVRFERQPSADDLTLDYVGRSVRSLTVNGKELPVDYNGAYITLPAKHLKPQNQVTITFAAAYDTTSDGMIRFIDPVDGKVYLYTNFEPFGAHRFFPCFDQPDIKARYAVAVDTPARWTVISNMPPSSSQTKDDRKQTAFPATPPLSPYLFALHAGDYVGWHDKAGQTPMSIYARASLARHVDAGTIFDITRKGLSWFGDYFALAYPFPKYDHVFVPEFAPGAMENPGAVTMNERMIYREQVTDAVRLRRDNTILHEMAHMWFGDLVTMRWWNDLWLNESFATYMASLANENLPRYGDAWLNFQNRKMGTYLIDEQITTHPIEAHIPDTDAASENFDAITYGKGAASIKQLAYTLGPTAFRDGVRRYFQQHAWGNTTLADFMAALQTQTRQDLTGWTRAWIQTAGLNAVEPVWQCRDGRITSFSLNQTAVSGDRLMRPHRTEVGFFGPDAKGNLVLQSKHAVGYAAAAQSVPELIGKACPTFVYVNVGDQDYAKVLLDPQSLTTVKRDLYRIQDPLVRHQVWASLWLMVRDQKLDVPAYLDLLAAQLPRETDPAVVETQLDRLATAYLSYLDKADRQSLAQTIEGFVWKQVQAQSPGSDGQLLWAKTAVQISRTPEGMAKLVAWLDGKASTAGLTVNRDLRWSILKVLATAGWADIDERLTAEKRRDPSDAGAREWEQAMANRPNAAYKAALWNRFLTDTTSSIIHLRSAMDGFHEPGQEALTKPYAEKFFAVAPAIYRDRDINFAGTFAKRLFPPMSSPAALAVAERFLQRQDLTPELRKLTLERIEAAKRRQQILATSRQALAARSQPASNR
jgi:aminopeptidase N